MVLKTHTVVVGFVLVFCGGLLLALGAFMGVWLDNKIRSEVTSNVVIDSPDATGYEYWQASNSSGAPARYMSYTLYNVSNIDDVLAAGATPRVTPVGPYRYRKQQLKFNVTFAPDSDTVGYNEWEWFEYAPDVDDVLDAQDPFQDVVYMLNPTYVGILRQLGGEVQLQTALTAPAMQVIVGELTANFPLQFVGLASFDGLNKTRQQLLSNPNVTADTFLTVWANYTLPPPATMGNTSTWDFMMLAIGLSGGSGISLESARRLWDPTMFPSLVSGVQTDAAALTWYKASTGDAPTLAALREVFLLTAEQLSLVLTWRDRFKSLLVPDVVRHFKSIDSGVEQLGDLGFLQWGSGLVLNTSVQALDPSMEGPPECVVDRYYYTAQTTNSTALRLNVTESKRLLMGERSLLDTTNVLTFMQLWATQNIAMISQLWEVDAAVAVSLGRYITEDVQYLQLKPFIGIGATTSLFAAQSVDDWLWNGTDPFLATLGLDARTALFRNVQSEAEALEAGRYVVQTGRDNVQNVQNYLLWENKASLCPATDSPADICPVECQGVCAWWETQSLRGTAGQNFPPYLHKDDKVTLWVSELFRPVTLHVTSPDESTRGIKLMRFEMDTEALRPDSFYFQDFAGFANLTSLYQGAPVFLSKPNFLDADAEWGRLVEGMTPDRSLDDTFIDVEPMTGLPMRAAKRLQLNIYLDNATAAWFNSPSLQHQKMPVGRFWPLVRAEETGEITDKLASNWHSAVGTPLQLRTGFYYGGVVLGAVLSVAGAVWLLVVFVVARRRKAKSKGYEEVRG